MTRRAKRGSYFPNDQYPIRARDVRRTLLVVIVSVLVALALVAAVGACGRAPTAVTCIPRVRVDTVMRAPSIVIVQQQVCQ